MENKKYPCECLDITDIQGWGSVSVRINYDAKRDFWGIEDVGNEASIDFEGGFECMECGESWERKEIQEYAKNK